MLNDLTLRRTPGIKHLDVGDEVVLEVRCRVTSLVEEQLDVSGFGALEPETLGGEQYVTFVVNKVHTLDRKLV